MSEYRAIAYLKEWEEFSYENGASGQRIECCDVDVSFRAGSLPVLTEKIREFFGCYQATEETCSIDWVEDNAGEVRVRLMEDDGGSAAEPEDFEKWKRGEIRLWDVTYSLTVERVEALTMEEVPS